MMQEFPGNNGVYQTPTDSIELLCITICILTSSYAMLQRT